MIGFALSGGGARGIAHLGVIKALQEAGINPDMIAGTSAGSIVGGLIAAGYSPDECLDIATKTKVLSIFKPSFTRTGLLSIEKLADILKPYLPSTFEELAIPLIVTTTEINEGKVAYFDKGELIPTILASSCIPVLFKPVVINGKNYVDGGVLNNLPAEPLHEKVRMLYGVSCNPNGYIENLTNARHLMERSALLAINGNSINSRKLCNVFIEPPGLINYSGINLSQAREIFDEGYKYTRENISKFAELNK
ncbi:MAG: patatin-like phospholipase family protein [Bacteroidota bacterium]